MGKILQILLFVSSFGHMASFNIISLHVTPLSGL